MGAGRKPLTQTSTDVFLLLTLLLREGGVFGFLLFSELAASPGGGVLLGNAASLASLALL